MVVVVTKTETTTMPRKAVTKQSVYRRRPRPRPRRRPIAGLLEPGQAIALMIDPPLRPNEQPVALTPNAGDILLRDASAERVTVVNQTDRVVAYLLTVVPSVVVKAAMVPWRRVIADLGQAVKNSGVLDRFAALLRK